MTFVMSDELSLHRSFAAAGANLLIINDDLLKTEDK